MRVAGRRRSILDAPFRWAIAGCWLAVVVSVLRSALHPTFSDLDMYREIGSFAIRGDYWRDPVWNTGPPFFQMFITPVNGLYALVGSAILRYLIVFAVNLALSIAFALVVSKALLRRGDKRAWVVAALAWLCAAPFLADNFDLGQINLLPALLCALAFSHLDRRRDSPLSGAMIGVAASIKVAPVLLLPYLWRRWRALGSALATGVALALLPALVYGWSRLVEATRFWLFESIPAQSGSRGFANVSLPGLSHRFFDAGDPDLVEGVNTVLVSLGRRPAEVIGSVAALALLVLGYLLTSRGPRRPAVVDLAVLMPLINLTGAVAWRHHLVTLLPAYAVVIVYLSETHPWRTRGRAVAISAGISLLLGYFLLVAGGLAATHRLWEWAQSLGLVTAATLAAVAAALVARNDVDSDAFEPALDRFDTDHGAVAASESVSPQRRGSTILPVG